MRVLMLSKACIVGIYQRKLEFIAAQSDIELRTLVPRSWQDERGVTHLERVYTNGYDLVETPIRFNGNFHLHYYPEFSDHLQSFKPDIVHIDEEPYNLSTFLALKATRKHSRAKSIFFSWQNIKRRYPFPFRLIEKYVLHHADYALMGTQSADAVWRAKGYRGPSTVVPQFGVDTDLFFPPPTPVETDSPVSIGYAGRLVDEKGIDLVLQALSRLSALDWNFSIIGGGPAREKLGRLTAQLGIEDRVHFRGLVPSVKMPECMRALDVLVIPSRTQRNWKEQYGRVILEAMASGTVVVGSNSGAIPDVIGNAGLVFPENNVARLTESLRNLIEHPGKRAHYSVRGRERVLSYFTQQHIADQTVQVYRELLR
jgi:glycosyltransferase involved in cell wall biosynthesis